MTTTPNRSNVAPRPFRLSRRAAVLGGAAGLASVAGAARILAQQATPEATPVASPGATPVASPGATPASTPIATPEPVYPLAIIDDQRPEWAGTPQAGGNLRLFVRNDGLETFTPTLFQQDFQVTVSYLDPLVWVDEVTLEPKPWLAEKWEWSTDGLAIAIDLRRDVTWHDGTPFTADDVRFSLLCYRDDYDSAVSFMLAVVRDVVVINPWKISIQLDEPDGSFPFNAGNLPIFSQAQYEAYWNAKPLGERTLGGFDHGENQPLGTGPWKIEDLSAKRIELVRNESHFAAVPLADSLSLVVEDDPERRLEAWLDDEVDLVWPLDGSKVEGLLNEKGSLVVSDSTISYFAAYNFGNPLRNDPGWMASAGMREALTRAIDRQGYAEAIFGGYIDVDRAGFMTQPWAIDPKVKNPKRDIKAARKLLADNGWADVDGDGVLDSPGGDRGALVCIVRDDADPGLLAILDTLNTSLNEIGFLLEVQRLGVDDFTARWTTTFDYDLIAYSLNQYAAFNEFDLVGSPWSIRRNAAGWNPGGYFSAEVDDAIMQYFASWEIDEMKTALSTIQRVTNDDPFALWLGFPKQPVLVRPDIAGFQPNKMWQSWNTWSLWQGAEASVVTPIPATPVPATPQATPDSGTPAATPVVATPVASPASPVATPNASPASD